MVLTRVEEHNEVWAGEDARILRKLARCKWPGVPSDASLKFRRLNGAMTNKVYECSWTELATSPAAAAAAAGGGGGEGGGGGVDGGKKRIPDSAVGPDAAESGRGVQAGAGGGGGGCPCKGRSFLENQETVLSSSNINNNNNHKNNANNASNNNNNNNNKKKVIIRIYGDEVSMFFRREDEIKVFEHVACVGLGPRLIWRFSLGRVEEYLHGRTLSARDLRDPLVSRLIAFQLSRFHKISMPGSRHPRIWERLRQWLSAAWDVAPSAQREDCRLDALGKEIDELERAFSAAGHVSARWGVRFCHNDLQYGNVMMVKGRGPARRADVARAVLATTSDASSAADASDVAESVTLIDYEYACYNYVAYDIGNFYCEMMADYHSGEPHRLRFDWYPDQTERYRFAGDYLRARAAQRREEQEEEEEKKKEERKNDKEEMKEEGGEEKGEGGECAGDDAAGRRRRQGGREGGMGREVEVEREENGHGERDGVYDADVDDEVRDEDIKSLAEEAHRFSLVSHIHWALWGILSARAPMDPTFDYSSYAFQRMVRYFATKKKLLAMPTSASRSRK
ncbi:hypothetical protein CBR_g52226 [Chara braunii]|uniref:Choline kinase N-terminal domain-containing protein n=1 Tax=Chara braunii TaxID=69332 RepID=A0A388M9W4_CHABU|nr:hypothetical protein CBR_g52226 [Chara braunii]|eukprot:GBG91340.1 hypothetical protein CBR_g52226 [Chara braunii]